MTNANFLHLRIVQNLPVQNAALAKKDIIFKGVNVTRVPMAVKAAKAGIVKHVKAAIQKAPMVPVLKIKHVHQGDIAQYRINV